MKKSIIVFGFAALALILTVASCAKKEEEKANAVAALETYLEFQSLSAPEQTLPIYADGTWAVDNAVSWITVTPMSGSGNGKIVVRVTDNATDGVIDPPRQGIITIQGDSRERNTIVTIYQKGDKYYGLEPCALSALAALEDEVVAKVSRAQVTALSEDGFMATDNGYNIYVEGTGPSAGDIISMSGAKMSKKRAPYFVLDEYSVIEEQATWTYPTPVDITDSYASFDYTVSKYVKLSSTFVGAELYMGTGGTMIPVIGYPSSVNLDQLDLHKVVVTGYNVGTSILATKIQDSGPNESLVLYPVKFRVRVTPVNYDSDSFAESSSIAAVEGIGHMEYVPFDLEASDPGKNYKLDVSDASPRVTGPWPGDYWLFYGNGAIKAGSEVRISFESRVSATGHKFWILEYLDGTQWVAAGEVLQSSEPGELITYTHAMNADGSTNIQVASTVKFSKNTPHAQFRFRCVANWRADGAGALTQRNTGTGRITVTDKTDLSLQPCISIIKEGNGVERDPVYADIEVSKDLLTFNGGASAKTLTVKSSHAFTLSTQASWLTLSPSSGPAGEETEVTVSCQASEEAELREATIVIVSEDSQKTVHVVQSAAGQQLDPFISISNGNSLEVKGKAGSKTVKVQANVAVEAETAQDWITVTSLSTKALVEWTEFSVAYQANEGTDPRTGQIRFFNTENNLEAILTLVQKPKSGSTPLPDGVYFMDDFEWLAPYVEATGAEDGVGLQKSAATAPNIYTLGAEFLEEVQDIGYEDLNPSASAIYLQKNYLKFSKGSNVTGLRLPALSFGSDPVQAKVEFDWCSQIGGTGKVDATSIVVVLTGGGTCTESGLAQSLPVAHTQKEGEMFWQHVTVELKDVTDATRIEIRPSQFGATSGYYRWFLDNLKVSESDYQLPDDGNIRVGTMLWEEWFTGAVLNQTPSAYETSAEKTTKVFGDAPLTYTQSGSTAIKDDGLVFYNKIGDVADVDPDYKYNLLIAKGNGFLDAAGIPCKGVKKAVLTYRSNSALSKQDVSTSTTGVTVGTLSSSSVPKLDQDSSGTKTVTITGDISVPLGAETLDLRITDKDTGSNIRIDGIQLVVTEMWNE